MKLLIALSLLILSVGIAAKVYSEVSKTPQTAPVQAVEHVPDIRELHRLVNEERKKAGVPELVLNEALNRSAAAKCADMVRYSYFAHATPYGKQSWEFIQDQTKYRAASENITKGSVFERTNLAAFMNSKSHREALLNPIYTDEGLAFCKQGTSTLTVQHLIAR